MNILLFVMSLLMLLALITYARLDNFQNMMFVQAQFKHYMENTERDYINQEAIKKYQTTYATEVGKRTDQQDRNLANKTLSLKVFIDKEERNKHPEHVETVMGVARNLIYFLYGDHPFFIEMEEKRPNFVNEILSLLMRVTEEFPPSKKWNNVEELAALDLKDPELNDVFTRMLKGAYEEPSSEFKDKRPLKLERGYYSLLDFISFGKGDKYQIRVFLASKQLLMALFGNSAVVSDILKERVRLRQTLFQNVKPEDAAKEFESRFSGLRLSNVPADMLNFGVSKTDPKKYE